MNRNQRNKILVKFSARDVSVYVAGAPAVTVVKRRVYWVAWCRVYFYSCKRANRSWRKLTCMMYDVLRKLTCSRKQPVSSFSIGYPGWSQRSKFNLQLFWFSYRLIAFLEGRMPTHFVSYLDRIKSFIIRFPPCWRKVWSFYPPEHCAFVRPVLNAMARVNRRLWDWYD